MGFGVSLYFSASGIESYYKQGSTAQAELKKIDSLHAAKLLQLTAEKNEMLQTVKLAKEKIAKSTWKGKLSIWQQKQLQAAANKETRILQQYRTKTDSLQAVYKSLQKITQKKIEATGTNYYYIVAGIIGFQFLINFFLMYLYVQISNEKTDFTERLLEKHKHETVDNRNINRTHRSLIKFKS